MSAQGQAPAAQKPQGQGVQRKIIENPNKPPSKSNEKLFLFYKNERQTAVKFFQTSHILLCVYVISILLASLLLRIEPIRKRLFDNYNINFEKKNSDMKQRWSRLVIISGLFALFILFLFILLLGVILFAIYLFYIYASDTQNPGSESLKLFKSVFWGYKDLWNTDVSYMLFYMIIFFATFVGWIFFVIFTSLNKSFTEDIYYEKNRSDMEQIIQFLYNYGQFCVLLVIFMLMIMNASHNYTAATYFTTVIILHILYMMLSIGLFQNIINNNKKLITSIIVAFICLTAIGNFSMWYQEYYEQYNEMIFYGTKEQRKEFEKLIKESMM